MIADIVRDLAFVAVAFTLGILLYKRLSSFHRIHLYQIGLYLLNYAAARVVTTMQSAQGLNTNNQWVFNIYILGEIGLILWAASRYYQTHAINRGILMGFVIFAISFVLQLFFTGFMVFANYAFSVGGVVIVLVYIPIVLRSIQAKGTKTVVSSTFYISLSMLLFYACTAPYIGLIHYIQAKSPDLNFTLYTFTTEILSTVRYVLVAAGFWFCYKQYKNLAVDS